MKSDEGRWLLIDHESLSHAARLSLVEEFVSRDGTDYGGTERSMEEKCADVMAQFESGEVLIVFDREEERVNVVSKRQWSHQSGGGPSTDEGAAS